MNVTTAQVNPICSAAGTVDLGQTGVTNPSVSHSISTGSRALSPTSAPPVTKSWEKAVALVAGAATIDLTALTQGNLTGTLDLTGLKVQAIAARGDAANTGKITLSVGATNGYDIHGSGAGEEILSVEANDEVMLFKNDTGPDVSGTVKTLDLAGTGTEVIHLMILAG